jgi:threonyl-tRNA synthetase
MLVAGDREAEEGKVSVRLRSGVDLKSMPVAAVVERIKREIEERRDTVEERRETPDGAAA